MTSLSSKPHRRTTRHRAARVAVGLVMAVMASVVRPSEAAAGDLIDGGGSSFVGLIMSQWQGQAQQRGIRVQYRATGSGNGRLDFISGRNDFSMSDIPFQTEGGEIAQVSGSARKDFRYVTLVAGALGFMFNLVGSNGQKITELNLTPELVCRIFTSGKTYGEMKWNDPDIARVNPKVATVLPDQAIVPVVRSDNSGTSYVLSEYCIATAPAVWTSFIGKVTGGGDPTELGRLGADGRSGRPISNWPLAGFAQGAGSDGLSAYVDGSAGRGSITYIESGYAAITRNQLTNAKVYTPGLQQFIDPSPQGITAALSTAKLQENGTFDLDFNSSTPGAYFPSTYSYLIVQVSGFSAGKGETLADFIRYAVGPGQNFVEQLDYAKLPKNLIDAAMATAARIPGAKPLAGTPPPPPPPPGGTPTPPPTPPPPGTPSPPPSPAPGTPAAPPAAPGTPAAAPRAPVTAGAAATPAPPPTPGTPARAPSPGIPPAAGTPSAPPPPAPSGSLTAPSPVPGVVDPSADLLSQSGASPDELAGGGAAGLIDPLIPSEPALSSGDPVPDASADELALGGDQAADAAAAAAAAAAAGGVPLGAEVLSVGPVSEELPDPPGPSNADAVWTMLQGAGVVAMASFLIHARKRSLS
jgi:phosphate transport system substrate-binding protein